MVEGVPSDATSGISLRPLAIRQGRPVTRPGEDIQYGGPHGPHRSAISRGPLLDANFAGVGTIRIVDMGNDL